MAFIKVIPSRFSRSIYYVLEIFLLSCFLCLLTMLEELACKVLSITFLGVFIVSLAFFELCLAIFNNWKFRASVLSIFVPENMFSKYRFLSESLATFGTRKGLDICSYASSNDLKVSIYNHISFHSEDNFSTPHLCVP